MCGGVDRHNIWRVSAAPSGYRDVGEPRLHTRLRPTNALALTTGPAGMRRLTTARALVQLDIVWLRRLAVLHSWLNR